MSPKSLKSLESVWEGVFSSFEEAGGDHDAFDTDRWIAKQQEKILALHTKQNDQACVSKDYPLAFVVAMLLSQTEQLSILDFGGGMGAQYLEILAKIPGTAQRVRYVIVDGERTIQNVPAEIRAYPNLSFYSSLEGVHEPFDIVHVGSTLQYIEDWQGLLTFLITQYQPRYFVFSDLLAGDIPTFVSHQIYYEKRIPHHFLNWNDFRDFMEKNFGFSLQLKSKFIHKILNQEEVFPNAALPKTHQIDRGLHAVFYRK